MTEKHQNGMECSQFETLLPEALDQTLSAEVHQAFQAHAGSCRACGPMLAEVRQGMLWLRSLEEVTPPSNLVHNILAATSAAEAAKERAQTQDMRAKWVTAWWKPLRGMLGAALQPRFATSFSMAFFSLSLTLTLAGIKLKDIARFDWRPSSVSRVVMLQYTQVESKVVRYYNNMRLVYEIESRVGELRKNSHAEEKDQQGSPDQPKKEKKKKDTNDTSGRPEQRQDNYSRETDNAVIAYLTPSDEEGANQ